MTIKLGVVMDPIESIHVKKDSTFAMLLEAQQRQWEIYYFTQQDLFLRDGMVWGNAKRVTLADNETNWFRFEKEEVIQLSHLSVILMRKDPPFDREYIYTTYLLEHAENLGTLIVNKPQSLRDANEKIFTTWFPQCCPSTLVTRSKKQLRAFLQEHSDIICKPLEAMGGYSVFRLKANDQNASVVFEMLTQNEKNYMMAQRYIPEIVDGDKRILMIDGKPIDYALARIPAKGELRGNLAAGGHGVARPLSARDQWICQQVGPALQKKGLLFVGLDVIGDYLTEINVTSPTCIRELDQQCDLNIASILLDCIERALTHT